MLTETAFLFKNGQFTDAQNRLDRAHRLDIDNPEIKEGLKYCMFWEQRSGRLNPEMPDYDRGHYILQEWDQFHRSYPEPSFFKGLEAIRHWCHTQVIDSFKKSLNRHRENTDTILLEMGLWAKNMGHYEESLRYLGRAFRENNESAVIAAHLGDVYGLLNQTKQSKILLKEAFFLSPSEVPLEALESGIIIRLVEKVKAEGYSGELLAEWLPVYACVWNIFNVRREIRPHEYEKLKQSIFVLKNRREECPSEANIVPRLINSYFRLLDYHIVKKSEKSAVDEILMNIQLLDASIYKLYTTKR